MFGEASARLPMQQRGPIRALMLLSAAFFALTALAYLLTIAWRDPIARDGTTFVVGRDFLNFWMYGRTALTPDPGRFYDLQTYNRELAALLGADYPWQNWSYPPSVMLLAVPFGALTYMQALLCWTVLGVAIFVWTASRQVHEFRLLIPVVLSPAAVLCLMSGQSSFVTAAILITIFAWLDRRPIGAGVLLGLLTVKPQLGLLFPVMLIASSRWRVFAAAAITAVAMIGLTATVFGPQVWIDYALKGIPTQNLVLIDPRMLGAPFMPTIFMNLRTAGAGYGIAMAVQICFLLLAVAAVFWAYRCRRHADPQLLAGLFLACTIGGLPYLLPYDTLAMTSDHAARSRQARTGGPAVGATCLLVAGGPARLRHLAYSRPGVDRAGVRALSACAIAGAAFALRGGDGLAWCLLRAGAYFHRPCASKASTSARRGAAALPPRRAHLRPAAAAAKRSAETKLLPSASASVKAPWKTSPAPSVSTAATAKAGLRRSVDPSRQSTSAGPLVTARKACVVAAMHSSASPRSSRPVVARRHSLENTTWVAIRNRSSDTFVGRSASSTTVRPRARAAPQIGRTKSG